jgi:uncharacterized protein (TIGR03435 family)
MYAPVRLALTVVATRIIRPTLAQPPAARGPQPGTSAHLSTADAKPIHFEVASIHRNTTNTSGGYGPTADGYDQKNMAPIVYIGFAYGVREYQRIQGLPDWCKWGIEPYDINAKVADADVAEWQKHGITEFPAALQALLQDRFKLKAHFENRETPAYALVVAKDGPKFKAATPGDTYPDGLHTGSGKPALGLNQKWEPGSDHGRLIGQAAAITQLAQLMSSLMNPILGRQVIDKTGLAGQYDFSMPVYTEWTGNHQTDESAPSIFTTLEESLGLKLEPTKTQVEFLIIDHIERPSEN